MSTAFVTILIAIMVTSSLALTTAVDRVSGGHVTTISNKDMRRDTEGNPVNAHDGNILYWNGTYYLYGENYGVGNYVVNNNSLLPKLAVYTSPDMVTWTWQGFLHNNTPGGNWAHSGKWPQSPFGTWWSPWAVLDKVRNRVVLWFTASPGSCCTAYFGVAYSADGIHFTLETLTLQPFDHSSVDGSAVLMDDDGKGYVAYTAMNPPGQKDHTVAIQRLSDDYLSVLPVSQGGGQVGGYFPDYFVEGVMIFKRKGKYYVMYSSCCCACREGSGAVVLSSDSIEGPWTRQSRDVNCNIDAPVCAGMPSEPPRPQGNLTISAQGIGISILPNASDPTGTPTFLWSGGRWLSAPNNPPKCTTLCTTDTGDCQQSPRYDKGADYEYWIPLQFDEGTQQVKQFASFQDTFTLNLP